MGPGGPLHLLVCMDLLLVIGAHQKGLISRILEGNEKVDFIYAHVA